MIFKFYIAMFVCLFEFKALPQLQISSHTLNCETGCIWGNINRLSGYSIIFVYNGYNLKILFYSTRYQYSVTINTNSIKVGYSSSFLIYYPHVIINTNAIKIRHTYSFLIFITYLFRYSLHNCSWLYMHFPLGIY